MTGYLSQSVNWFVSWEGPRSSSDCDLLDSHFRVTLQRDLK